MVYRMRGHPGNVRARRELRGVVCVMASISGTRNRDKLVATAVADSLFGLQGNDSLWGRGGNDRLYGGDGRDLLDGGKGRDILTGGKGNDTYIIDNVSDRAIEKAGQGIDLVKASVGYVLAAHVENLILTGSAAINGTGNDGANIITGNGADNVIDGGAGADSLFGGAGDDTYVVDNAGDVIGDTSGIDLVKTSVGYTLTGQIENLTLTGSAAINGTGNDGANIITGNGADNVIDGGAGADSLFGGAGNDTFIVDNTADIIDDTSGVDLVKASVSWTLSAAFENLSLTGSDAINGFGNTSANIITGNDANNLLDGGAGADTLAGGAGNDTLIRSQGVDTLSGGQGADTFQFRFNSDDAALNIQAFISDFEQGADKIDLHLLPPGIQFIGNLSFSGLGAVEVRYDHLDAQSTIVQIDLDGDSLVNYQIVLQNGNIALQATDFILL